MAERGQLACGGAPALLAVVERSRELRLQCIRLQIRGSHGSRYVHRDPLLPDAAKTMRECARGIQQLQHARERLRGLHQTVSPRAVPAAAAAAALRRRPEPEPRCCAGQSSCHREAARDNVEAWAAALLSQDEPSPSPDMKVPAKVEKHHSIAPKILADRPKTGVRRRLMPSSGEAEAPVDSSAGGVRPRADCSPSPGCRRAARPYPRIAFAIPRCRPVATASDATGSQRAAVSADASQHSGGGSATRGVSPQGAATVHSGAGTGGSPVFSVVDSPSDPPGHGASPSSVTGTPKPMKRRADGATGAPTHVLVGNGVCSMALAVVR